MKAAKRIILFLAIFVSCVGCDQATKSLAKSVLTETLPLSYFHDTVRLHLVYNQGAFLSLGAGLPAKWRAAIFASGVAVLLLGVLAYAFLSQPGYCDRVSALALVFSGGFSNLLDRMANGGSVADFLNVGIGPVRTGIFNVADIAIMGGFLILIVSALRRR